MSTRTQAFFTSVQGLAIKEQLLLMVESKDYQTKGTYSATSVDELSFVDKHMKYMSQFPTMNCAQYVSNLRLKTKIR